MEQRLAELQAQIQEYRQRSGELQLALETLTTIDPVTGVRNRSGIMQSVEGALQWNRREGTPFGVMAVHIPGLADIVSREAPEVAEEAMAHSAAVISAGLRAVDRVGRWSDTLFLVVLAKLRLEGAAAVSKRIASMLSAVPFHVGDGAYPLIPRLACALIAGEGAPGSDEIVRRLEKAEGSEDPTAPEIVRLTPPEG